MAFAVVLALTAAGIATLWLFLAGLPILLAMLWLCLQFGRAERARFAVTLGVYLPAPLPGLSPGASRWGAGRTPDGRARHPPPVRLRGDPPATQPGAGLLATLVWSLGVALLGMPFFSRLILQVKWQDGGVAGRPWVLLWEAVAMVAGCGVLLAAPRLTLGLAAADTVVARYLIGPGGSEDMTERVDELEASRARVVDAAEAERRRIERDLHDGAQQRLVAVAMDLGRAQAQFDTDPKAPGPADRRAPTTRPSRRWPSCATWPAASIPAVLEPTGASTPPSPAVAALAGAGHRVASTSAAPAADHRGHRLLRGPRH